MTPEQSVEAYLGLLVFTACVVGFFWWGHGVGYSAAERDAVRAGVGEFYLDEDGKRQFRWRTKK